MVKLFMNSIENSKQKVTSCNNLNNLYSLSNNNSDNSERKTSIASTLTTSSQSSSNQCSECLSSSSNYLNSKLDSNKMPNKTENLVSSKSFSKISDLISFDSSFNHVGYLDHADNKHRLKKQLIRRHHSSCQINSNKNNFLDIPPPVLNIVNLARSPSSLSQSPSQSPSSINSFYLSDPSSSNNQKNLNIKITNDQGDLLVYDDDHEQEYRNRFNHYSSLNSISASTLNNNNNNSQTNLKQLISSQLSLKLQANASSIFKKTQNKTVRSNSCSTGQVYTLKEKAKNNSVSDSNYLLVPQSIFDRKTSASCILDKSAGNFENWLTSSYSAESLPEEASFKTHILDKDTCCSGIQLTASTADILLKNIDFNYNNNASVVVDNLKLRKMVIIKLCFKKLAL